MGVSAAKFARAEKDLKSARPLGTGAQAFYQQAEVNSTSEAPKELYVAMTSDRGLAGAVHSSINKKIRGELHDKMAAGDDLSNVKVICVGDKSRAFSPPSLSWSGLKSVVFLLSLETLQRLLTQS